MEFGLKSITLVQLRNAVHAVVLACTASMKACWMMWIVDARYCITRNSADAGKLHDAFRGQSRSPNIAPLNMLD